MYSPKFYMKKIKLPMYPGILILIFTNSLSKIKATKLIDKSQLRTEENIYSCMYNGGTCDGHRAFIIVFNFWSEKYLPITFGEICHESVHAANSIFHFIEAKCSFTNDEPYAYLCGWIANEIGKMMAENKIELKSYEDDTIKVEEK